MNGYAAPLQESRIQEFHYRFPRRSQAVHPGYHESVQSGPGQDFRAYEPLFTHRDARRLDLRVSLRDPFGMPHVRVFNQRSTVPVYAVADLSGSMGSVGDKGKLQPLAEFTAAAALSAYRTGDPFGFIGCDTAVRCDLLLPAAHQAGAAWDLADRLSNLHVAAADAAGLREASRYVSVRRSLVFLVSDFHLPFALIDMCWPHCPGTLWCRSWYGSPWNIGNCRPWASPRRGTGRRARPVHCCSGRSRTNGSKPRSLSVGRDLTRLFIARLAKMQPGAEPRFDEMPGVVKGLIVGVGAYTLTPIPKFNEEGEQTGFYNADDVPHASRFGLPGEDPGDITGHDPRNAPFGREAAVGNEHLSSVRESYLKGLGAQTGWIPALVALLILVFLYGMVPLIASD